LGLRGGRPKKKGNGIRERGNPGKPDTKAAPRKLLVSGSKKGEGKGEDERNQV